MSQNAAVYLKKHEYPVIQEREIPKPKGSDALLKVTSLGLNPIDFEYGLFGDPPKILGVDLAGVIEEVGPDVKSFKKGDRVISSATGADLDHGAYQQYVLIGTTPNLTAKLPDNITDDEGATLITAINTAQVGLYDESGFGFPNPFEDSSFGKGKSILVAGGSSAIGLAGLQFLKLSGFDNIITTASKSNSNLVKSFGATHVIDRSLPPSEQVKQIKFIAPDLQYSWDCVGNKDTNTLSAQSFGPKGGEIVSSLPVSKEVLGEYTNVKGKSIYSGPSAHPESAAKIWSKMTQALKDGTIKPLPYKVHDGGLDKIYDALQAVKKVSGYKIVIHPQE